MRSKTPAEAGRDLRAWLAARNWTEEDLSRALSSTNGFPKVSQSWISRICTGQFKRFSGKTIEVMRYADIRIDYSRPHDVQGECIINAAVAEVWDGSVSGAKALARVLRSAAALARETKA